MLLPAVPLCVPHQWSLNCSTSEKGWLPTGYMDFIFHEISLPRFFFFFKVCDMLSNKSHLRGGLPVSNQWKKMWAPTTTSGLYLPDSPPETQGQSRSLPLKLTACMKMFILHSHPCFLVSLFTSFLSFSFSLSSSKHIFWSLIDPSSKPNIAFSSSRDSTHLQDLSHSVTYIRKCSLSYLAHDQHSIYSGWIAPKSKPERTKCKWYFKKVLGEMQNGR